MKCNKLVIVALLASGMLAGPVSAATTYTVTASGLASDGRPDNAEADFTFNGTFNSLSITLTNTANAGQLGSISSVLDGIAFNLSGVSMSALSLTSLSDPNGTVSCTGGGCVFSGTPVSLATSQWSYNATTGLLAAGNGSFTPYEIVNSNIMNTDGIPNAKHNPFLMGPATFVFSITNPTDASLSLTSANLYFGTIPDVQTGIITSPVPLPETFALMLAGLGVLTFAARRGYRKAA